MKKYTLVLSNENVDRYVRLNATFEECVNYLQTIDQKQLAEFTNFEIKEIQ